MLSMFEIVTDSSANLTDELIEQYQLPILSLTVRVEGQEYVSYVKGRKSDIKPIYDKMRQKKPVETSAANPGQCHEIFEELLNAGKDLLYIGCSAGWSGT